MQRELSMSTKGIRFLDTFCIHFHLYTLSNFVAHLTKMSIADLIVVPSSVAQCWFIAADDRTPKHFHTNRQTAIPLYPGLLHFMTVANDNKDNSCVTILIGTFFYSSTWCKTFRLFSRDIDKTESVREPGCQSLHAAEMAAE